jgi:hypothetical protein
LSQAEILVRKERREAFERREREAEEAQRRGNKGSTRIYDAIAEEEDDAELGRRNGKKKLRRESNGTKKKEAEDSSMMDNFGDMLKEYLTRTLAVHHHSSTCDCRADILVNLSIVASQ